MNVRIGQVIEARAIKSNMRGSGITDGKRVAVWLVLWMGLTVASFSVTLVAGVLGSRAVYLWGVLIGGMAIAMMLFLRQHELATTIVIAVHLYVDWYLGIYVVALVMTLALLVILFLARSPRFPWTEPRALWLWVPFLALTLFPAIRGANNLFDAALYYPNDILGALLMFWLGMVIVRDSSCLRRLLMMLVAFGALIALHTIVQELTGKFLFETSAANARLASVSAYELGSSGVDRVGSFFVDPNWDGTLLAMMLALALGLFVDSPSLRGKVFYLTQMALIFPALLFTYSIGSVIGASVGVAIFIIFVGSARYRVFIPALMLLGALALVIGFPTQLNLLLQHSSDPSELLLRNGAWATALRLIQAFPLMGVGLGQLTYAAAAEPYRVPAQFIPLSHPHDSYLELAAMAGIPVLLVFLGLLFFALWLTWRSWVLADVRTRALLGAVIAATAALSANSVSINGWTLPPLSAMGWLLLGAGSSPLLLKSLSRMKARLRRTEVEPRSTVE